MTLDMQLTDEEIKEYKDLLAEGLVQPTEMELYILIAFSKNKSFSSEK